MLADPTIKGHPTLEIFTDPNKPPTLITVCAECGAMRSIIMLVRDRWYCSKCRAEGASAPKMFPIA